jgi:formylglycine-generating enzyme required for sulfatase activity
MPGVANTPYVFISYKTEDRERVANIRSALEAAGLTVWQDIDIGTGDRWRPKILARLEAASCVLVCWSHAAVASHWVCEEAEKARQRRTYLPILLDGNDGVDLPFGFSEYQALKLTIPQTVSAVQEKLRPKPTIFVAGTLDDLVPYRDQVRASACTFGFEMVDSTGKSPDFEAITAARLIILLVAHRYGPFVREQYEYASRLGKSIYAFVMEDSYGQPAHREKQMLEKALDSDDPAKVVREVKSNIANLADFRASLKQAKSFTSPASLRTHVVDIFQEQKQKPRAADDAVYLEMLEDETRQIRIRGLKSKRAEPYVFGIDEIYIPLTTVASHGEAAVSQEKPEIRTTRIPGQQLPAHPQLQQLLAKRRLVIIGDPGAGKSTFLRRVVFELCRNLRRTAPVSGQPFLDPTDRRFPILIRISDFCKFLSMPPSQKPVDSPDWIPTFLAMQSQEFKWRLSYDFFEYRLTEGGCLVLVDGLDEAPSEILRERTSRIFEKACISYSKCDFVVTTRPQSYEGDSVLNGFQQSGISALTRSEIDVFLVHFANALALDNTAAAKFQNQLRDALDNRIEIREMAMNPVMLTALAVLQHNDHHLPEHRVQLYESILAWLAVARIQKREQDAKRPSARRCLEIMRRLALQMQDSSQGRLVQINRRRAAEFLHQSLALSIGATADDWEELLRQETEDSGIISAVGSDVKFWHLSFQEYLAAREIASLPDGKQVEMVTTSGKLYRPEWRETMRLLGAVLKLQGTQKIEGLLLAILATIEPESPLPKKARCVALLGCMMRDLSHMDYEPSTPDYKKLVQSVMRIFERGESQELSLKTRIEAADALGQVGDPRLEEDNWVGIPASTFWMGAQKHSPAGRNFDIEAYPGEFPVREVSVRKFRIRRYPVTVQEYAAFVNSRGYVDRRHWFAGGFKEFRFPDKWESQMVFPSRPVVGVSWFEAAAYCAWAGGRLPTEAEWERTARGPNGTRHPWGSSPMLSHRNCNYAEKGPGHPSPVGLYPLGKSEEGILDLLGNVLEWVSDWWHEFDDQPSSINDPLGPKQGDAKVIRGGSWGNSARNVRVSCRAWVSPTKRYSDIGFRCARDWRSLS